MGRWEVILKKKKNQKKKTGPFSPKHEGSKYQTNKGVAFRPAWIINGIIRGGKDIPYHFQLKRKN